MLFPPHYYASQQINCCRVFAQQRSGHHAVVNWLCRQLPGKSALYHLVNENGVADTIWMYKDSKPPERTSINSTIKVNNVVFNVEGRPPSASYKQFLVFQKNPISILSPIKHEFMNVIVIRDILNTLASRINHFTWRNGEQEVSDWKEYAKEVLRQTKYLKNPICILFNLWFVSLEYRKNISKLLGFGMNFTDIGLQDVPCHGGGSSFDGLKKDGHASEMRVLNRYHGLWHKISKYIDEEAMFLNRSIFTPCKLVSYL